MIMCPCPRERKIAIVRGMWAVALEERSAAESAGAPRGGIRRGHVDGIFLFKVKPETGNQASAHPTLSARRTAPPGAGDRASGSSSRQLPSGDGPDMSAAAAADSPSSSSPLRLEGKVALVTGGASGIGEAIVRLFRQHGAKVCIADVNDEAGQRILDSLGGDPAVLFVHCDVTVEEDVSQAVDAAAEKFGTLDIMVNNAGITGDKVTDIRSLDFAEVKKVFDINVHGMLLGMKHAARVMIPNSKGSIVSLASVASVLGGMGPHAYTASKHAVVGLTKSVALELGRHGIRVNCVSPYAVPTALSMPHLPQGEHKGDAVRDFLAFVGSEANLKGVDLLPKDVAEAVLYLASDEARYVSALNLVVDGGFTSVNHNLKAFED